MSQDEEKAKKLWRMRRGVSCPWIGPARSGRQCVHEWGQWKDTLVCVRCGGTRPGFWPGVLPAGETVEDPR